MLQLIAYNQNNNAEYYLDIDKDESISLNFAVSEIKDFSTRHNAKFALIPCHRLKVIYTLTQLI